MPPIITWRIINNHLQNLSTWHSNGHFQKKWSFDHSWNIFYGFEQLVLCIYCKCFWLPFPQQNFLLLHRFFVIITPFFQHQNKSVLLILCFNVQSKVSYLSTLKAIFSLKVYFSKLSDMQKQALFIKNKVNFRCSWQ